MNILFFMVPFFLPCLTFFAAPEDSGSFAVRVRDASGMETQVSGFRYCHEEEEGGELYLTRYEEFFIQRGEAIIKAGFDSLASVEFTGEAEVKGGKGLREALILTRSGKEVRAKVICHQGACIKGQVDLGEFSLPMEKVKKIYFSEEGKRAPELVTRIFLKGETPGHALPLILTRDGSLFMDGGKTEAKGEALIKAVREKKNTVFLRAEKETPYAVFVKKLLVIQQAGARYIFLGP